MVEAYPETAWCCARCGELYLDADEAEDCCLDAVRRIMVTAVRD